MNKIIIPFDQNQHKITSKAVDLLKPLVDVINYPGTTMKISGFASTEDSPQHNMDLSIKRAKSIQDYLISKGAKLGQITLKAYGEDKNMLLEREFGIGPDLEARRAKNRRVEVEYVAGEKPKPDQYKELYERWRTRINKTLEAFRWTSRNAKEKLRHVTSLPNKNAAVTVEWQSLIDNALSGIAKYEKELKELDLAEIMYKTPEEVWKAVFKPTDLYKNLIGYMDEMILADETHVKNARIKLSQANARDKKYYSELIEEYQTRIKSVKEQRNLAQNEKLKNDYYRIVDSGLNRK
jgi:hypothetical protein